MSATVKYLLFLGIFLLGCNNGGKEKGSGRITFNLDSYVVTCDINQDSLKDGTCFVKDSSGNLLASANYKKGVRDGVEKQFYLNGQEHIVSTVRSGRYIGKYWTYYKNGILKTFAEERRDGIFIGEVFRYNKKGNLIKYEYRDRKGELTYLEEYDSLGTILNEEGSTIADVIPALHSWPFSEEGEVTCFWCLVATPPTMTNEIKSIFHGEEWRGEVKGNYALFCTKINEIGYDTLCVVNNTYRKGNSDLYRSDTFCVGFESR